MKKLALLLVLVVFLICGTPVSAGIEPVPWIIGKLGAIESQMTVVDHRHPADAVFAHDLFDLGDGLATVNSENITGHP